MTLRGSSPELVRTALKQSDSLPGTAGFAGRVDGLLARDVLGREPLFFAAEDPQQWSHNPRDLQAPVRLPAGAVHDGTDIERRFTLPESATASGAAEPTGGVETVRDALDTTFSGVDQDSLAVGFSGGVDSTLVAAALQAPLYTVGFPESHDLDAARSAATLLDRDLRTVELDPETLEQFVPAVAQATGRTNAMDVAIALPLYALAERVRADGFDRLAVGQGADELFGGYAKVARAPEDPRVAADTVGGARREMVETLPVQLERDVLTLRDAGVEPVVPLLHDRVVEAALSLPGDMLVTDRGERKWAFRVAAREWVPDTVAFREKKALQYGSLVSRELDRLAREAGFKRREDDHVTRYVADLVDGAVPAVSDPVSTTADG
jgi:asparagine synthase (glutamine-hydrolysing)